MNRTKLATLIGAIILSAGLAARAQAIAPDPNFGLTTSGEEALIPHTQPDSPQLAVAADPNVAPTTTGAEALIAPTSPDAVQLAVAPDTNFGEPVFAEAPVMQVAGTSGSTVAAMQ